jgi:hypothetical protein
VWPGVSSSDRRRADALRLGERLLASAGASIASPEVTITAR